MGGISTAYEWRKKKKKKKTLTEILRERVKGIPPGQDVRYYGTPEQQKLWGIQPLRYGTFPTPEARQRMYADPLAAIGYWQDVTQPLWYRLLSSRAKYTRHLLAAKEARIAPPAPEMGTTPWLEQETEDIFKMMEEQGFGPTVEFLKREYPEVPEFPWYHHLVSGVGKSIATLQKPMSGVLGLRTASFRSSKEDPGVWDILKNVGRGFLAGATLGLSELGVAVGKQFWPGLPEEERPFTAFWKGLTGKEFYSGSRTLTEGLGVLKGESLPIKALRGTAGFALEMGHDPLTFFKVGGHTALGKSAKLAEEATEAVTEYGVKSGIGGITPDVLKKVTTSVVKPSAKKLAIKGTKRLTKYAAKHPEDLGVQQVLRGISEEGPEFLAKHLAPTAKLRGLVGQTRHLGMVGKPAAVIGSAGDIFRHSGLAKTLHPIFTAPGKVSNWLGTSLEPIAKRYRGILTRSRSTKQWAEALLAKELKAIGRGMTPETMRLARDVPEIFATELAEHPRWARYLAQQLPEEAGKKGLTRKALASLEDVQSIARTLGQESPFAQALGLQGKIGLEETAQYWGTRGLHKGETAVVKAMTPKQAKKVAEVVRFLRSTGEQEMRPGLLKGLNPAYMPHFILGEAPAGLAPHEYSEYLASGLKRTGKKTLREIEIAQKAGTWTGPEVELNLMKIMERRGRGSIRALVNDDFQRQVGEIIEEMKHLPGVVQNDWKKINIGTGRLQGMLAQPELAEEVSKFSRHLSNPQTANVIWRAFDRAQSIWKLWATSLRPGFHLRNHYSNLWLRYLADPEAVDPRWTFRAAKLEFKRQAGMKLDDTKPFLKLSNGENLTEAEVMELITKTDIAHPGGLGGFDEPMRGFKTTWEGAAAEGEGAISRTGRAISRYSPVPVTQRNIIGQGARHVGEAVENTDRIALFLQQLSKTSNLKHAEMMVKKYLLDYGELSDVERIWMRRIFPFFSWVRKAVPLMMKEFVQQPGKFTTLPKLFRAVRVGATGSPEVPEEALKYMPEYMGELGAEYIGIPGYEWVNPNFPQQELNKLMTLGDITGRLPGAKNIPLPIPRMMNFGGKGEPSMMEALSPFFKTPIEYATGYNLFLGQPIEPYPGKWRRAPGWTTLPGIRKAFEPLFVKTPSGRMPKEMPPGEYLVKTPKGEVKSVSGASPEAFKDEYMMRGRTAYFLSQLPFVTEIGKVVGEHYGTEEPRKRVSRALSTFAGVKPLVFDRDVEEYRHKKRLFGITSDIWDQLTQTGLAYKPLPPEAPYPPDLYAFPQEIEWRMGQYERLGIPLAKMKDIETAIQNTLPNLPNTKRERMAIYRLMGYDREFIDLVEKLYKQFYRWKKDLRPPKAGTFYMPPTMR